MGSSSLSIKYGHNPYLTSDRWRFTSQHEPHLDGQPWWRWLPAWAGPRLQTDDHSIAFVVPLYIPFVLLSLPTAYLWLRRRVPPGSCRALAYPLANLPPNSPCPEATECIRMIRRINLAHGSLGGDHHHLPTRPEPGVRLPLPRPDLMLVSPQPSIRRHISARTVRSDTSTAGLSPAPHDKRLDPRLELPRDPRRAPLAWWFDVGSTPAVQWCFIPSWMPLSVLPRSIDMGCAETAWSALVPPIPPPPGLCPRCAYSLADLPVGNAVPECGALRPQEPV
jgi:hypothetical protein